MISETPIHTGKFFGEVDGTIFESLIHHEIFNPIKIYDYQAICLETQDDGDAASMLLTVRDDNFLLTGFVSTLVRNLFLCAAFQVGFVDVQLHPRPDRLDHHPHGDPSPVEP